MMQAPLSAQRVLSVSKKLCDQVAESRDGGQSKWEMERFTVRTVVIGLGVYHAVDDEAPDIIGILCGEANPLKSEWRPLVRAKALT